MNIKCDSAVSPVIGVLLMLVVTIIIAAVVSGFAGSIGGADSKVPQATIKAEYSQSGGMKIIHSGGDPMETKDIRIQLHPSSMIENAENWVSQIQKKYIYSSENSNFWVNPTTGTYNVGTFKAGDRVEISPTNCSGAVLQPEVWNYSGGRARSKVISNSTQIGKIFYLEFFTTNGKMIAKVPVTINP